MLVKVNNTSGFSILMAIGTIAVLLILVTSLAVTYVRESKLSRFSYDEVLSRAAAEGTFEYGMLKIANHRDGFQDGSFSGEQDGNILDLSTPRSQGLHTEYHIEASSTGHTFSLSGSEHLIIPLFVSTGSAHIGAISLSPLYNTGVANVSGLSISGIAGLSWTIVATDTANTSTAITGVGDIGPATTGAIRIKKSQCYSYTDWSVNASCTNLSPQDEEIFYSYDETKTVAEFLTQNQDPYFIVYNPGSTSIAVNIASQTPFSFPTTTLTAKAQKGESSQVFQFAQDKWKYYDALKYGIYNNP